jgi:hypothetical protein
VLDSKIALTQVIVRLPGEPSSAMPLPLRASLQSEKLLNLLFRHEQAVFAQAQQSTDLAGAIKLS